MTQPLQLSPTEPNDYAPAPKIACQLTYAMHLKLSMQSAEIVVLLYFVHVTVVPILVNKDNDKSKIDFVGLSILENNTNKVTNVSIFGPRLCITPSPIASKDLSDLHLPM